VTRRAPSSPSAARLSRSSRLLPRPGPEVQLIGPVAELLHLPGARLPFRRGDPILGVPESPAAGEGWYSELNSSALADASMRAKVTRRIPVRKIGTAQEVGRLVARVLEAGSEFLTGETITI
jgi:hypothetical protein